MLAKLQRQILRDEEDLKASRSLLAVELSIPTDPRSMDLVTLTDGARNLARQIEARKVRGREEVKETAVMQRRLGEYLRLIRDKLKVKGGAWTRWLADECQISPTGAREAIRVFENTASEDVSAR
jgi:hypothetical protein